MAPTTTPQDVTGYLASPAANQRHASCWHIDPYCPPEIGPRRAVHGTRGLVALAAAQATRGRAPCSVCAYDTVLAATAVAEPDAPGWHYLACALHERTAPCKRCATLSRYGAATGAVATTNRRGGVALLIPGAGVGLERQWLLLIRMELTMRSAPDCDEPAPSSKVWASAAELAANDVPLAKALVAASALHTAPGRT